MYSLSGFDATQCNQNFRLSGSPLLIRFNDSTNLDEITEPVAAIPQERFRFNDHSELFDFANTNTQLPGKH
ncbi:unnamed protein product [Brassica rapa subsp. narinosa]